MMTMSVDPVSDMAACGATGTPPKQRNSARDGATIRTSNPGWVAASPVRSVHIPPTEVSTSYSPYSTEAELSLSASRLIRKGLSEVAIVFPEWHVCLCFDLFPT